MNIRRAIEIEIVRRMGELQAEDYAFTVEAAGSAWDVYRITINGIEGMVAWRPEGKRYVVGYCGRAREAQELAEYLTKNAPN